MCWAGVWGFRSNINQRVLLAAYQKEAARAEVLLTGEEPYKLWSDRQKVLGKSVMKPIDHQSWCLSAHGLPCMSCHVSTPDSDLHTHCNIVRQISGRANVLHTVESLEH